MLPFQAIAGTIKNTTKERPNFNRPPCDSRDTWSDIAIQDTGGDAKGSKKRRKQRLQEPAAGNDVSNSKQAGSLFVPQFGCMK
jgi:hypothetical protein